MVFFKYILMTTCLIPAKTAKYKTKLNKKPIEILFNELFVLDDHQQNEKMNMLTNMTFIKIKCTNFK